MKLQNYNTYFFFGILGVVSILTFFLFRPFLTAILTAAILAALFQSTYKHLVQKTKGRKHASALLTVAIIFFIIIIPVLGVTGLVTNEANKIFQKISSGDPVYQQNIVRITGFLEKTPFFQSIDISKKIEEQDIAGIVQSTSKWILTIVQKTYQGVANFVLWFFVMFFTLYYFLIEGKNMIEKIMFLSPLKKDQESLLVTRFLSISKATLKGTLITGLVQGTLGGILFFALGIPSAIVWSVVMMIVSIIPLLGAGIVWFPVAVIMIAMGEIFKGIIILAFGVGVISTIDNILRPKLVGRDTQMHPLLVFFATLGGIAVFGIAGFLIGPIIMALFLALWEIYAVEFKDQLEHYNTN
ncbi:MAG: AI-2E family transporter [bacterium]